MAQANDLISELQRDVEQMHYVANLEEFPV